MVDFALQLREIVTCRQPMRLSSMHRALPPIMIRPVAAIIGTLPIAMSSGMGCRGTPSAGDCHRRGSVLPAADAVLTPALYVAVKRLTARVRGPRMRRDRPRDDKKHRIPHTKVESPKHA